ncbi:fasciclin domain protein [Pedobacter sp. BAL39]|uniref:fasciclin domain-containing protein n=1 Tax=Pedobacter sp. BAL39 TaxID=391596 RepID=UPI000155934E|nr:fasciclin domain-containing protein [Pedobacter sp. BAL39]EDM35170.1 fasciclin domain protein [Pedobacter sp. BAL39]
MKLSKSWNRFHYLWLLLLLAGLSSCKHDNLEIDKANENFRPAADFIKNNYDLSLFAAAVEKAGMNEQLNGAGPFTILAPDNNAFNMIGINRPSDFDKMNPDSLKYMVQSHILNERLLRRDIPFNGIDVRYRTLAGNEVYASVSDRSSTDNLLFFSGAFVSRFDVTLANGNLNVLNRVIKYEPKVTVQEWLDKRPDYSILVSGLKKFGLWEQLAKDGSNTVVAPKNSVFEAAGMTAEVVAAMNTDRYIGSRLFGCYVLKDKHFFISDFDVLGSINGDAFYYHPIAGDTYIMVFTVGGFNGNLTYHIETRTSRFGLYEIISNASGRNQKAFDNLLDNGLVQDLDNVIILPEQAMKTN